MKKLLIAIILLFPISLHANEWDSMIAISAAAINEQSVKSLPLPPKELPVVTKSVEQPQIRVVRRMRIWPF